MNLTTPEPGRCANAEGAVGYTIHLARTEEALHALAPEWRLLYQESRPHNPFLSYEWTAACRTHRRENGSPFVLTCRLGPRLVGLVPLCLQRKGPFRVLRFIGDGESDYLGFLCAPDQPQMAEHMLSHLERLRACWDVALLRPLSRAYNDPFTSPVPGLSSAAVDGPPAPYLTLPADWDELVAEGPAQIRHTRRWARKFEREGGRIEHVPGRDAVALFDQLVAIESNSWKAREGVSWCASARRRLLLRDALETVTGLEVWLARLGAQPIAYLVNFVTPERVLFYRGAYDQAYRKYYPGGVLHLQAIRAAWTSGLREYDFLVGGEEYKSGWTTGVHRQRYLSLMPDTVRGRAAFGALVAPRWFLRQFQAAHTAHAFAVRKLAAVRGYMGGGRGA